MANLLAPRAFWEYFEYFTLLLVFFGVSGESLAELWNFPTDKDSRHRLAKGSALILIFGLALELLSVVRTNVISDQAIANLNMQAQQAREKADLAEATAKGFETQIADANARVRSAEATVADANARAKEAEAQVAAATARAEEARAAAEQERLERIRLETLIAPRLMSPEHQQLLANGARRLHGEDVQLISYSLDLESVALGLQIKAALTSAGVNVEDDLASVVKLGGFYIGVDVYGPSAKNDLVLNLETLLTHAGVGVGPSDSKVFDYRRKLWYRSEARRRNDSDRNKAVHYRGIEVA